MERRGPHVTDADVAEFERQFGYTLPEDYRQFLLDVNGGRPADSHCKCDLGVVNQLFSLRETTCDARDLATRAEHSRAALPSHDLLHIGHDDGGARILIALAGEHRGEIWLQIVTDARPIDANPRVVWHDRRDFKKLAHNFKDFMTSLKPL